MPADHEISAHALELAIHGRGEPTVLRAGGKSWRTLAAGKGWETASGAGSANIPAEASAALLGHARPGRELDEAIDLNTERFEISQRRWWLAEPDSIIYSGKIESSDAGVVFLADRIGARDLADAARRQLRESAERSCLMRAILRDDFLAPNPKSSADNRTRYTKALSRNRGRLIVCRAGCRSWGHVLHVESPMTSVARMIFDGVTPRFDGSRVGDVDGSDTTARIIARLWPIFREAFEDARRMSVAELVESAMSGWSPARGPFQYIGWSDGSRLCIMGSDEVELKDEDTNSNTPGILAFGILKGRLVALPEWPAPNSGDDHIRQTNVFGDVDLTPDASALSLLHSHAGRERVSEGGRDLWRTVLVLPDPRDRIFHLLSEPGQPWRSLLAAAPHEPPVDPPPPPPPGPVEPPVTPAPQPPKSRLPEWLRKLIEAWKEWWSGR